MSTSKSRLAYVEKCCPTCLELGIWTPTNLAKYQSTPLTNQSYWAWDVIKTILNSLQNIVLEYFDMPPSW